MAKKPNKVVEQATAPDGTKYRMYDDGNCYTTHLFTIEKCVMYGKVQVWKPTNGITYTDYKEANTYLKSLTL